jgi:23S rRNA (uracil1939-C5)-methyltransferase
MPETLTIHRLGHRGDGIADTPDGPFHVAGALPGEAVEAERVAADRGRLVAVATASPERVRPPCPHFGVCGGCVAQHMSPALYAGWRRETLRQALAQRGLTVPIADTVTAPPESRRRVVLALARQDGRIVLGFHEARSERVVDVPHCRVAEPAIVAALPMLTQLLSPLAPATGAADVTVLATASGLDVAVGGRRPEGATTRLAEAAGRAGLARLAVGGEVVAEIRPPQLDVGGVVVTPPPGAFVQAVATAETALAEEAVRIVGKAKQVADLFAGSGAFTLRLARAAQVHAVESDGAAIAAMTAAARQATGLKPITSERRDLFRAPLSVQDLARFDAVVLDPPRQGAEAQSRALAAASVQTIAYVSCAPSTFARDARLLVDGGYTLESVTPVDQFLWSHHLETIAAFRRSETPRGGHGGRKKFAFSAGRR